MRARRYCFRFSVRSNSLLHNLLITIPIHVPTDRCTDDSINHIVWTTEQRYISSVVTKYLCRPSYESYHFYIIVISSIYLNVI